MMAITNLLLSAVSNACLFIIAAGYIAVATLEILHLGINIVTKNIHFELRQKGR